MPQALLAFALAAAAACGGGGGSSPAEPIPARQRQRHVERHRLRLFRTGIDDVADHPVRIIIFGIVDDDRQQHERDRSWNGLRDRLRFVAAVLALGAGGRIRRTVCRVLGDRFWKRHHILDLDHRHLQRVEHRRLQHGHDCLRSADIEQTMKLLRASAVLLTLVVGMAAVCGRTAPGARPIQSLLGVGNGPAPPPTGCRRVFRRQRSAGNSAEHEREGLADAERQLPGQHLLPDRISLARSDAAKRRHPVARHGQSQRRETGTAGGLRSLHVESEFPWPEILRAEKQHAGSIRTCTSG